MVKKISLYKHYYKDFLNSLGEEERKKIERTFLLLTTRDRIPSHYIKYLKNGIYEFRVTHCNKEFRVFICFDGDKVVVFNGIVKKQQKLRNSDLRMAIKLKNDYYGNKKQ